MFGSVDFELMVAVVNRVNGSLIRVYREMNGQYGLVGSEGILIDTTGYVYLAFQSYDAKFTLLKFDLGSIPPLIPAFLY